MTLEIGTSASLSKTITDDTITQFAKLIGDNNPVHLDDDYAKSTIFKKRIAHGMLCASLISAVIGTQLPGPGTIYLSQTMKFVAPVYSGDTVTAEVTIKSIRQDKGLYTLQTICHNQKNKHVVEGEAVVMLKA